MNVEVDFVLFVWRPAVSGMGGQQFLQFCFNVKMFSTAQNSKVTWNGFVGNKLRNDICQSQRNNSLTTQIAPNNKIHSSIHNYEIVWYILHKIPFGCLELLFSIRFKERYKKLNREKKLNSFQSGMSKTKIKNSQFDSYSRSCSIALLTK